MGRFDARKDDLREIAQESRSRDEPVRQQQSASVQVRDHSSNQARTLSPAHSVHTQSYEQYRHFRLRPGRPRIPKPEILNRPDRQIPTPAIEARERNSEERGPRERDKPGRDLPREREISRSDHGLTDYETKVMTDIGRFRVVRVEDLAQFHGSRYRLMETLEDLRRRGLVETHLLRRHHGSAGMERVRVATLTHSGKRQLRRSPGWDAGQALYTRLVKAREAFHDSKLYAMYQCHVAGLVRQGAVIRRVQLDYELKREYLRDLRRREAQSGSTGRVLAEQVAADHNLPIQQGKVQYPDLRIEYETPGGDLARVELELATAAYHAGHLAQKQQAGFVLYAARGEQESVGARVRDDHELVREILSF